LELADLVAVVSKVFQNRKQSMASNATYLLPAYNLDSRGKLMSQIEVCKLLIEETFKPGNISDLMAMLVPAKGFPDLRQLALTVLVANFAAERSFSSMWKINLHSQYYDRTAFELYCSVEY